MKIFLQKSKIILAQHWLAVASSFLIGLIYLAPHIWFIISNPNVYQGVPFMQTANEDFYISRVQEVIDGHPLVGSQALFEYKDQLPLQPPTAEFLYALPTLILGIPLSVTLIVSKFLLPGILFLLVYALLFQLLGSGQQRLRQWCALAGAFFITLGYDLVDYRTVFGIIRGDIIPSSWLVWSRPINPITGAIFLFSFLLCFWSLLQNQKYQKRAFAGSVFFLALMFASYFFSWGLAVSIMFFAGVMALIRRDYPVAKNIIFVLVLGLLLASPYWYISMQAQNSPWYQESLLRSGLFYTHYPVVNKVLLAAIGVYLIALTFRWFKGAKALRLEQSDFFSLAFLLGGLWALNQQIVTGIAIWPFHFVQYTIPLSIIAVMVALYRTLAHSWKPFWISLLGLIFIASLWFGIFTQYATYVNFFKHNQDVQAYAPVFSWFNQQEKDCVVLVSAGREQFIELSGMLLAFTHCNIYSNTWVFSLMPQDRIYHSYFTNLRFRGVTAEAVDQYVANNDLEMRTYLFTNWINLFDDSRFPDFKDRKLPPKVQQVPTEYRNFLGQSLVVQLNQYRLDYILSVGELRPDIKTQLPNIELEQEINGLYIYKY